jgi:hypothetical protein
VKYGSKPDGQIAWQMALPRGSEMQIDPNRQQIGSSPPQTDSVGQQPPSTQASLAAAQEPAASHGGRLARQTRPSQGTSSSQQTPSHHRRGRQQVPS